MHGRASTGTWYADINRCASGFSQDEKFPLTLNKSYGRIFLLVILDTSRWYSAPTGFGHWLTKNLRLSPPPCMLQIIREATAMNQHKFSELLLVVSVIFSGMSKMRAKQWIVCVRGSVVDVAVPRMHNTPQQWDSMGSPLLQRCTHSRDWGGGVTEGIPLIRNPEWPVLDRYDRNTVFSESQLLSAVDLTLLYFVKEKNWIKFTHQL